MKPLMGAREWLALSLVPRLGAGRIHQLYLQGTAWPDGWLAHLSNAQRSYLRYLLAQPETSAEMRTGLGWPDPARQRYLVYRGHAHWPLLLDEIDDPPALLWAEGNLELLRKPALAIVGSRNASRAGRRRTLDFASHLASAGICIVSGLARGIDAAAHQGALEVGGATIGVLGCGIDIVYPPCNHSLYAQMRAANGLLVTEFPPGTQARPAFFPRRNRIVTALARGVLVIEAALRSGSLISARLALEQNRDVFALPGECDNPQAAGCLWLIQEGARLITQPREILEEPGLWDAEQITPPRHATAHELGPLDALECSHTSRSSAHPLLAILTDTPAGLDGLAQSVGMTAAECLLALQWLELEGHILRVAGGWVRAHRCPDL